MENIYMFAVIGAAILLLLITILIVYFISKKNKNTKSKDYYSESRKVKDSLGKRLRQLFGGKFLNESDLENLEEILISSDIGPKLSSSLIEELRNRQVNDIEEAITFLKGSLKSNLIDHKMEFKKGELNILLVLGVNGVGKTTSIAKITNLFLQSGHKVLVAAGDTFRAAATEQLGDWCKKLGVPIIKQQEGADPGSVVFDAVDAAKAKGVDLLIVDTAGRLHNKKYLMDELRKIDRIIESKGDCTKSNLLVIDSTTGQNGIIQATAFNDAVGVNRIMLTKYDADTKGGIVFTIQKTLGIPFAFVGIGEKVDDIEEFNCEKFVDKIFN